MGRGRATRKRRQQWSENEAKSSRGWPYLGARATEATRGPTDTTRLAFVSTSNQVHRFSKKKSDPPDLESGHDALTRWDQIQIAAARRASDTQTPNTTASLLFPRSVHTIASPPLASPHISHYQVRISVYKTELRGVYINRNLKLKQTTRKLARRSS
jgi:hypothetical protein